MTQTDLLLQLFLQELMDKKDGQAIYALKLPSRNFSSIWPYEKIFEQETERAHRCESIETILRGAHAEYIDLSQIVDTAMKESTKESSFIGNSFKIADSLDEIAQPATIILDDGIGSEKRNSICTSIYHSRSKWISIAVYYT